MIGKVVLITGGTSGIGKAAATALAKMGANVVLTGRNRERGEGAVEEIRQRSGNAGVSLMLVDFAVQAEIRRLAREFEERYERLDVLINNAGMSPSKRTETTDGIETTLAVNHLAPFLLTNLLLDLLKGSAPSRVVTVSSRVELTSTLDLNDLQAERNYGSFRVYARSKQANVMFTYELAERLRGSGVTANCMGPGLTRTNLGGGSRNILSVLLHNSLLRSFMRSPQEGADTVVYLASSPDVEGMSGKYLWDRKVKASSLSSYDESARKRLWEISEQLTGITITD